MSFQVEADEIDKSKIKVEETSVSEEDKQKLQQQSQNAPPPLLTSEAAPAGRNSSGRAVDFVNACGGDGNGNDGTVESPNVTSALPTTVITTQRHRMITTAGHIRWVEFCRKVSYRYYQIKLRDQTHFAIIFFSRKLTEKLRTSMSSNRIRIMWNVFNWCQWMNKRLSMNRMPAAMMGALVS